MLDEPRELLLRALLPLYPPEPPPSPLELRDPPPLETLRFPTRSPPPPPPPRSRTSIAASRATVCRRLSRQHSDRRPIPPVGLPTHSGC